MLGKIVTDNYFQIRFAKFNYWNACQLDNLYFHCKCYKVKINYNKFRLPNGQKKLY